MKTIFRYANLGLLMALVLALGAVAASAQNPCEDADGITKLGDSVREKYAIKTVDGRKAFLDVAKQFSEKYAACEPGKELGDWLKTMIPRVEKLLADQIIAEEKARLTARFDGAMKAKNWDEVYASGKEILNKYPDDFRAVELVLGSIGYDELLDRQNGKYSDETLRFAKQSLADLEAGKEFKPGFGVAPFSYKSKDDAIAWMNLTIGSIYQIGLKNKSAALPYLYKATLAPASSDVSTNPNPYEFIGSFYFDELNKLVEQIQNKAKDQKDTDTPEVAQQKVDEIKKLVAMSNGTAERAMDAFSRAFTLGKNAAYKAKMKKNVQDAYKLRFAKEEGVEAWITSAVTKPFPNPSTPIQPITDPEPVKTDATSTGTGATATTGTDATTPTASGSGAAVKPVATPVKPAAAPATTPVKNTAKPAKPQSSVKKAVAKKAA